MATLTANNALTLNNAIQTAASGDTVAIVDNINLNNDGSGFQGTITIPATANLTLTSQGGPFTVSSVPTPNTRHFILNGALTLTNIILDGGSNYKSTIPTAPLAGGGGIVVNSTALLTIETGAVIENCFINKTVSGQAVQIPNGGTCIMNNGLIQYNYSTSYMEGGAVGVYTNGSTFELNGGSIQYNGENSGWGNAGIRIFTYGSATMNGGTINNNSGALGSGVNLDNYASFTMNDGQIINNTAANGGGVRSGTPPNSITINKGTISNNTADPSFIASFGPIGQGGGFWFGQGTVTVDINNAIISNNTAATGGGIYSQISTNVITISNSIIEHNDADGGSGGGYYIGN